MIKNIIFDYGAVIFDIDHQLTIQAFKDIGLQAENDFFGHLKQNPIFDLFEKGSSTGVSSSRTLSGSQSIEHQVGSQDMGSTSANMVNETSSSPSDRCSFILQEIFDILIALAASSLNLDTKSQFVSEPSTFGSGIHVGSTQTHGFISSMLHLASVCKCPVPLYPLCSACNAAHIAASCVSWLLHEVVVLSTAGCVFVLRHMLLPKMPQNFNSLNCCLSLSVNLGHVGYGLG